MSADTVYGELTGDMARVFRDGASLFESPEETSPVICQLQAGSELFQLAGIDVQYDDGGMSSSWIEASCIIDGETFRGYIPQPWLALTDIVLAGDTLFILGIDSYYSELSNFIGSARAVCRGEVLWETAFYLPNAGFGGTGYSYSVSSREINTPKFRNVRNLVVVSFIYEACGYENRDVPFAWTGSYLIRGPSASRITEAGIFHYTEEFLFPDADTGTSDILRITSVSELYDEETGDYIIEEADTTIWLWNGLEFNPL